MHELIERLLGLMVDWCTFYWSNNSERVLCRRLEHAATRGAAGAMDFEIDLELLAVMRTLDDDDRDRGAWN
jgi:hypothetical protein